MSRKTPHAEAGQLHLPSQTATIALDTDAWFDWLADDDHRCFHFTSDQDGFTARKEQKQRGGHYWVAYRQTNNHLHKVYLGKSNTLTEEHLRDAAERLANAEAQA